MKEHLFSIILMIGLTSATSFAQNTFPSTGYVGIGTATPAFRMHMIGGHGDTNFGFHFNYPDVTKQADLTLWASEPGWTYSGTGIGNNVYNSATGSGGIVRLSTARGGSYMRLLDQEIRLNVVKSDGTDIYAMHINPTGDVGIGTTSLTGYKLAVAGNMIAESMKVKLQSAWPDYVFSKEYQLPSLETTKQYIREKGHLPDIPSASTVKANGVDLGEMNARLLQKIEELTLHLINQNEKIKTLEAKVEKVQQKMKE